jgi:phosphatidylserine decarboxylase
MMAREGIPFALSGLALTVLLVLGAVRWDSRWLLAGGAVLAVLTIFTTFFFRDPQRLFAPRANVLVAPADGRVIGVDTVAQHAFIGGEAVRISIFLSIFDVHVNRIPADGTVDYVKYLPGKFFAAFEDKASELNEQTEIGITTSGGAKVVVKQIAGIIARRIVCRLKPADVVAAGERFGLIRFGSRTELLVPRGSEIAVTKGDHVFGGSTVLGTLPCGSVGENVAKGAGGQHGQL